MHMSPSPVQRVSRELRDRAPKQVKRERDLQRAAARAAKRQH